MVNTGTGGINQYPTTRVYDVVQQKNISKEHEMNESRSGEVKGK